VGFESPHKTESNAHPTVPNPTDRAREDEDLVCIVGSGDHDVDVNLDTKTVPALPFR
jgi:hypothetical protein